MKDWEISETYVLPRILCLRPGNDALLGKQSKPNLRFFSLNDRNNEWITWKRSDYFYPEMIPEPDYSDSGEDVESEEDDGLYPRSAFERLRDLTEVYVSNVDAKKAPAKPKKTDSKKAGSPPATDPKKTKGTPKDESKKPAGKTVQAKKSPPTSPKAPKKAGSKSPAETAKAKGTSSTDARANVPPRTTSKSPPKTKSPPPASKSFKPTTPKASPSAEKKPKSAIPEAKTSASKTKPESRPKSPPAASKTKPVSRSKSPPSASKTKPESRPKSPPPAPSKTKSDKPAAKGKASPKVSPKAKAKGPAVAKMATPGGDSADSSAKPPPSSPSKEKTLSPASSAASEDQSSDDELIKPKKPVNPYLDSTERQKLHKELKFSQKYGKLGASSKTELQLALERYTENKMKRELNAEEKTSLEKILEFQAKKIEMQETMDKNPAWVDRLQKPPVQAPDPKTDEFYRVHARVVNSSILTHCFLSDDERSECSSSRRSDSGSDS